jgi:tetratricopeptide (TPR) repeat protein
MRHRIRAFFSLLVMIEKPESLNDDSWWSGQRLVAEEFGNTLAVAGARGKLRIRPAEPTPAAEIDEWMWVSEDPPFDPSPGVETPDEANKFPAERHPAFTEEEIGKEVEEILAGLFQQGPEPAGSPPWNPPVESESAEPEPSSLPAPDRSPREHPRPVAMPERPREVSKKWETYGLAAANVLSAAAIIHHKKGRYDKAVTLYERALLIREKQLGPDDMDLATTLNNLAVLYLECGRYLEAEKLCSRSLAIVEKAWGPSHPKVARRLSNLAGVYAALHKDEAAAELYERALAILEATTSGEQSSKSIAASLAKYVSLLLEANRESEARRVQARIRALSR